MSCDHVWEYIPKHKLREAKYWCSKCDADMSPEQFETIAQLKGEILSLESALQSAQKETAREILNIIKQETIVHNIQQAHNNIVAAIKSRYGVE